PMTIRTSCDCGKTFQLRDELAGTRVKCPDCGRIFEVPVRAVVVEDLPSTANIVAPRALAASIQPITTGRGPLLAVAAVFGGLALLFLLFLTISLARRMGNSTPIVATQAGPSTTAVNPPPPNSTTPPPTNGWTPPIDQ